MKRDDVPSSNQLELSVSRWESQGPWWTLETRSVVAFSFSFPFFAACYCVMRLSSFTALWLLADMVTGTLPALMMTAVSFFCSSTNRSSKDPICWYHARVTRCRGITLYVYRRRKIGVPDAAVSIGVELAISRVVVAWSTAGRTFICVS